MSYFEVSIPADEKLGCVGMGNFPTGGDGYIDTYWD